MGCGCPPLAVDMGINGRLSAVLAFTSTGCTTSAPAGGGQLPLRRLPFSARDMPPIAATSGRETPLATS